MSVSLKSIIEALLFAAEHPLSVSELFKFIQDAEQGIRSPLAAVPGHQSEPEASFSPSAEDQLEAKQSEENQKLGKSEIREAILLLIAEYQANPERGFELIQIADGFQFRTKQAFAPYLRMLHKTPQARLSRAALETLAVVAYRQPITRPEIDLLRGVDSGGVLKTLIERNLVRIVGRKEEPGKPALYGTSNFFLETFHLSHLKDLPPLKDLQEIEQKNASMFASEPLSLADLADHDSKLESQSLAFASLETDFSAREEEKILESLDQELKHLKDQEAKVVETLNPTALEDSQNTQIS